MARIIKKASFAMLLVTCVAVPVVISACSSAGETAAGADEPSASSIGLELQVGTGLTLAEVSYTISGSAGFTKSGALDVSNSTVISGVISGLPVGAGYTVSLSGTTSDGSTTCAGSASFSVTAHETTLVSVHLVCHEAPSNGSVAVDGTLNVCPIADGIMATPAEVLVGGTLALSALAHDPDNGPSPLSYQWSASSGTFSDATVLAPTFTCTTAGTATITVLVSDGDANASCADQASVTVQCTPTASDVQAILNANCISCHSGAAPPRGLTLVDVRAVVGTAAVECTQKLRIVSGDSAHSFLVDKLLGAAQDGGCFSGKQMPLGKAPLAASDISLITSWINAGTP
jgi:hypothetical protein